MKKKLLFLIVPILIIMLGVSFAYFTYEGFTGDSEVITGQLYLKYQDTNTLSLSNIFPETRVKAMERIDNVVNFTVKGKNTHTTDDIFYSIGITYGDEISGKTRIKPEDIRVYLESDGNTLVDGVTYQEWNDQKLYDAVVKANTTTEQTTNYTLRVWVDENVLISDSNPNANYTSDVWNNSYISLKVVVEGVNVIGYVTYDLSSYGLDNPEATPIFKGKEVNVTSEVNKTTLNNFRGWSTTLGGEVVYQPGDTIASTDIVNDNVTLYPYFVETLQEALELDLPNNIQAADTEGNRYLTGDKNTPNYLWYSGKLWRIVSINSDGTIKLVTQGNMTNITWNTDTTNSDYSTSQVHTWLNNEFLPTLETSVLADSTWDYTTYAATTATKAEPTAFVENEKVGLLTIYDYYKVRNGYDLWNNFLNNEYHWWTMSPRTDGSYVWYVDSNGDGSRASLGGNLGVRPSVDLKSYIQIIGGSGTKSNPYVIGGDKDTGVTSELLSNRISGEYISFNNVLYRIVGTEQIEGQTLTKITMADYSLNKNTLTTSIDFYDDYTSQRLFNPAYGIGLYLEEWYQADSTSTTYSSIYIKDNYKAMIATHLEDGVVWYTGPSEGTDYYYTLSKTGTSVSATIGIGYYGEMFSSQFGDGNHSSNNIWLMTIFLKNLHVWKVSNGGLSSSGSTGVRPSFYLKSDVKIVSGNGQPSSPYQITQ